MSSGEGGVECVPPMCVNCVIELNAFGRRKSVRLGISRHHVRMRRITLKNDSLMTGKRIPIRSIWSELGQVYSVNSFDENHLA